MNVRRISSKGDRGKPTKCQSHVVFLDFSRIVLVVLRKPPDCFGFLSEDFRNLLELPDVLSGSQDPTQTVSVGFCVVCFVVRVVPLFFHVDGFPSSGFLEGFGWILSPRGLDPRFPSTFSFTVEVFLFSVFLNLFATETSFSVPVLFRVSWRFPRPQG